MRLFQISKDYYQQHAIAIFNSSYLLLRRLSTLEYLSYYQGQENELMVDSNSGLWVIVAKCESEKAAEKRLHDICSHYSEKEVLPGSLDFKFRSMATDV